MKAKYYFINNSGNKVLARTSANEYKYALIMNDEKTIKCSIRKDICEREMRYMKKYYGYNQVDLKIVDIFKEVK